MKASRVFRFAVLSAAFAAGAARVAAQSAETPPGAPEKAAVVPDLVSNLVDFVLGLFGVESAGNTWQHWMIAALVTVVFYVLRKVVARSAFALVRRLASRTETTLDDELITAWQKPVYVFIAVLGTIVAVKVLKLTPEQESAFVYIRTIALSIVALWFLISTITCILDHLHEAAKARGAAVAAFMPWIKKTVITVFMVFGVLIAAQSLGADVKAFLQALGIGGLAFALAAQDTLANVFGSVVVAVDQPFRIGETVQIGAHQGTVEDIGLRSTKLRTPQRTLIAIPNKTVAGEAINNFGRMPERRVEQTVGLTYSSKPEQIEGLLADIRGLLARTPEVHPDFIAVNFVNFGASSLDVQIIYFSRDVDLRKTLELRERINLDIMRLVAARGLAFAFPTQTVEFAGRIAERMAGGRAA